MIADLLTAVRFLLTLVRCEEDNLQNFLLADESTESTEIHPEEPVDNWCRTRGVYENGTNPLND